MKWSSIQCDSLRPRIRSNRHAEKTPSEVARQLLARAQIAMRIQKLAIDAQVLLLLLAFLINPAATMARNCARHQLSIARIPGDLESQPEAGQAGAANLEPGNSIRRELAGAEAHLYRVAVNAGQYLSVVVEQKGCDAEVALSAPDGRRLVEADAPVGKWGPETVSMIAEVAGDYTVQVRSLDGANRAGEYEIKILDLRQSAPADKIRIAGQSAFEQGRKLRSQPGTESRRLAIEKYKEAVSIWRELGDRYQEAKSLYSIGKSYFLLNDLNNSIEYFNQALSIEQSLGDHRGEAIAVNDLALAIAFSGNMQKAIGYFNQALSLWQSENDRANEADAFNSLGRAYDILGEPDKASNYYDRALEIQRNLAEPGALAATLNNLALLCKKTGDLQKSLEYYEQALSGFRSSGERNSEATALNNTGAAYLALGDLQTSLDYYNQALPILNQVNDRLGQARTLGNIGYAYALLGEFDKALRYYDEALPICRQINNRWMEAYTLANAGQVYDSMGDMQKALQYYDQALALRKDIEDRQGKAALLDRIGHAYVKLGDPQKAMEYLNQALLLWQAIGDRRGEAMSLQGMALVERSRGNAIEARRHIESAIGILESFRAKVASQQLRTTYLASVRDYYDLNIATIMSLHKLEQSKRYDGEAFEISERARARSLLEMLSEAHTDIRQGIDAALLERERALQRQLNAKSERLTRLLSGKHTEDQRVESEKELSNLMAQYEALQGQIKIKSPRYAALTQPEPLKLAEIQQQVLDPDTLLLEYSLGDDRSYLWAVTQTSFASYELPGRKEIETQAKRVYELLTARQLETAETPPQRQARIARADAEYWSQAARLSNMLLGPASAQLGAKRLLVIPEGALQYVPFSALPAPADESTVRNIAKQSASIVSRASASAPQPLMINHEIINLPSASILAILRREIAGRKPAPKAIAVIADPVFDKGDFRVKALGNKPMAQAAKPNYASELSRALRDSRITREGLSLPRLPSTRHEADAIKKVVSATKPAPAEEPLEALDFMASRATATGPKLSQYRIVHFATHGLLNNEHPELSGIVLSLIDEQGKAQDGFLRLHDIYNLNLPAELVVLSACSTGLGKQIRGEGLVGLTRGFMYAGAARVMASLWNINDQATARLMEPFYRAILVEGKSPAEALKIAQTEMWQTSPWKAPYFWAAFVLQGEWK